MNWYSAHLICYWSFLDGVQDRYSIWESLYLIRARSRDAAVRKAHKYGKHEQIPHNLCSSTIDDRPVRLKYAGIRKLSLVECPESGPESGTLLSKFVILPKRTEDLKALVGCEEVDILLYPQEDVISINESTTE